VAPGIEEVFFFFKSVTAVCVLLGQKLAYLTYEAVNKSQQL